MVEEGGMKGKRVNATCHGGAMATCFPRHLAQWMPVPRGSLPYTRTYGNWKTATAAATATSSE